METANIPSIISANTYFWASASNASSRRRNEEKRQKEVFDFFLSLGMNTTQNGDTVVGEKDGIIAVFSYSESCKNVYKTFTVTKNGKRSNISALKKIA